MRRILASVCLSLLWTLCAAQDLSITNARIIDGDGGVIDQGVIVISDGRIDSVSAGSAAVQGTSIDARGMTVMPGYIDAHRHVMGRDAMSWLNEQGADRMQPCFGW